MHIFEGVATAIVTPFTRKNKINFDSFARLVDYQLNAGINALVFLGTTGEASTLSEKEKYSVAEWAVSYVNKKVPVILGAGGNNTQEVIKRSKKFAHLGADALLQVTPYYNKATQNGLIQHFSSIAQKSDVPQILYNVPTRTSVNILPETIKTLSKINNIIGLKQAGSSLADLTQILAEKDDNLSVYSGDDENFFTTLALGGQGVISVTSNICPKQMVEIYKLFKADNLEKARQKQFEMLPLIRALFSEINPIPVKAALNILGFNVGIPRMPLTPATKKSIEKLNKLLLN